MALWLCSLQLASATQFFVNQSHPAASDKNPGTRKKPLKTISAAVARVRAGDKVTIYRGDYREVVIIKASGTRESPIVIEAAPGETVVIKGSDVVDHWKVDQGSIWTAKLPKTAARGRDGSDPTYWTANEIRQVFIRDGILLDAIHLRRVPTRDKLQPGGFYHDRENSALYVWLPDSGDPNKFKIEASVRGAWLKAMGSYITVRGLQMRHASTTSISNWPACNLYGEGSRMENCSLSWADFSAITLAGKGHWLVHCLIACNGNSGIGGTGENHLIEGCRVLYNNIDRYDPSWHCGGAKLIPKFSKSRVVACEFAYNIGAGLWIDDGCNDNRLERNYCHDNEGAGIMVEISSGNLVMNNICAANRNWMAGEYLSSNPDADKRGNPPFMGQMLNDRTKSTVIYQGGGGMGIFISSAPGSRVYNNTCYLNEGGGITVEGAKRESVGGTMTTRDCRVQNNISVYNKGPQLIVRKNGTDADTTGNSSDYNVLLAVGSILTKSGWWAEVAFNLADWQRISGQQDTHSIESDPHFAMPLMGDFQLSPDSPALKAGCAIPELKDDFFGQERKGPATSIGACQGATLDFPKPAFDPSWRE